jgi:hypothetical protein
MKSLRTVVFILAMLVLATQAVRHAYVRFIEPQTSALDTYDQTETQKAIQAAESLEELLEQYAPARQQTDDLKNELKDLKEHKTHDEILVIDDTFREDYKDDYERERDLKKAIKEWEQKSEEILELRVFWAFGFGLFLLGVLLQARGYSWFGMSLLIPGVVEMVWWTSPSFRFAGSPLEFDRLLMNKLVFTLITIVILTGWWALLAAARKKQDPVEKAS